VKPRGKIGISAVVHTRNEASNIEACLASLKFADEIVVVDNESSDRTVALARQAGAQIRFFKGDYGYPEPARAYGLTQLSGEWIFILDADERATPELGAELTRLAQDPQALDGYLVPIKNFHFGRWLKRGGLYPDWHLRFFRRGRGHYPETGIHRGVRVEGTLGRVTEPILHYSYRHLEHYFEKFNRYTSAEAARLREQGHQPTGYDLILKPWHRFIKAYGFRGGFRDGLPGFLFHVFSAAYIFVSELKTWDAYRQEGKFLAVGKTLFTRRMR
jgi:(heptosyl)LPS beta-1,4-glucosyltransferase